AASANTWDMFYKTAQDVAWVPFRSESKEDLIIENKNAFTVKNRFSDLERHKRTNYKIFIFCKIHKKSNHTTNHCRTLALLKKNGLHVINIAPKVVRNVKKDEDEEASLNIEKFLYTVSSLNKSKNPFHIKIAPKVVRNVKKDEDEETSLNIEKFLYTVSSLNKSKNPFNIKIGVGNQYHEGIIDT
ncbi:hypothetical protein H312_02270, partial [Anncaliia algerae PRA339]